MSLPLHSVAASAPRILLCRHGNTFNPGDAVVMVGAGEDLPLTETGEAQARAVAAALTKAGVSPARVLCGTLRRTRRYAELLCTESAAGVVPHADPRLNELDYGGWSGLSTAEIVAQFGAPAWEQWHSRGVRPSGVEFIPNATQVRADIEAILKELSAVRGLSVVITSNGRIREFGAQSALASEQGDVLHGAPSTALEGGRQSHAEPVDTGAGGAKTMRTGHVSLLAPCGAGWRALIWDIPPAELDPRHLG